MKSYGAAVLPLEHRSGAAFKIESCDYDEEDKLWLITLTATDKGSELANEYIEYQKKKVAESDIV
ncbi:unnamed protein product, partial [Didymodactylos carnosus]